MLKRVELRERTVPQVGKGVGSEVQGLEQGCPQRDPAEQEDLRNDGAGTC